MSSPTPPGPPDDSQPDLIFQNHPPLSAEVVPVEQSPARRSGRPLTIALVAGMFVLGVGAAAGFALTRSDTPDPGRSPEAAARELMEAINAGDCRPIQEAMSTERQKHLPDCSDPAVARAFAPIDGIDVSVGDIKILDQTEDAATARVAQLAAFGDGDPMTLYWTLELVREDSGWTVDTAKIDPLS